MRIIRLMICCLLLLPIAAPGIQARPTPSTLATGNIDLAGHDGPAIDPHDMTRPATRPNTQAATAVKEFNAMRKQQRSNSVESVCCAGHRGVSSRKRQSTRRDLALRSWLVSLSRLLSRRAVRHELRCRRLVDRSRGKKRQTGRQSGRHLR